jgi:galactokinase
LNASTHCCDEFTARLRAAGLDADLAAQRAEVLVRAKRKLDELDPAARGDSTAFLVPGRIEFLGKHTDYAGGRSLLCAADRGFGILAVPRTDSVIRVADPFGGKPVSFELSSDLSPALGHWSNYPMTVARRLAMNFPGGPRGPRGLRGADIGFASDLPPSAGLSSSSAIIVAFYLALASLNRLSEHAEYQRNIHSTEDLAGYLGTIENGQSFGTLTGDRGVGTFGGSEDHTAILCARPDMLRQYSFCPVRAERSVPMPSGYILAIGVSGVVAEKTGEAREAYNAVSRSVSDILGRWRRLTGRNDMTLAQAIQSSSDATNRLRQLLGEGADAHRLLNRLEQFIAESTQIIPAATDALAGGRLDDLGIWVDRSQELGARLLGNQIPETIFLARAARECGAAAASAFGAGFGGSVWALIRSSDADPFLRQWRDRYQSRFPAAAEQSAFFLTHAGWPAMQV